MPRHGGRSEEEELRRWLAEAGLPPARQDLTFDWARWTRLEVPHPRPRIWWKAIAAGAAAVLVALSIYHVRTQMGSPTASGSAAPAATVNAFVSAFVQGHVDQAARLTIEGSGAVTALEHDRNDVRALLVNQAPFLPITKLHWATHCARLTCEVLFSPMNHHVVEPIYMRLQMVGGTPRVPMNALESWLHTLGRSGIITPALTWKQARRDGPAWVREPTWLPPGVGQPQLTMGPVTASLTVTYAGPHDAWTLQVFEWAHPITVSNPNEKPGTLAGLPVTTSEWQSTSGTPLSAVVFRLNGHVYQVLGINQALTVVERVASSLIR